MGLKIFCQLLFVFLVFGCNKKESKKSTPPSLVISGSGSANAFTNYLKLVADEKVLAGSPTSLILKLYAIYISKEADCTSPIKVADFGAGKVFDLLKSPTLFSGNVTSETYECLILKMSDNISYKVDEDAIAGGEGPTGACENTSTLHLGDIHHDGAESWFGLESDSTLGQDNVDQKIYLFASTNVDTSGTTSPRAGIHENQSLPLTTPLVVPGKAVFFADFANGIENATTHCGLEGGEGFGFR